MSKKEPTPAQLAARAKFAAAAKQRAADRKNKNPQTNEAPTGSPANVSPVDHGPVAPVDHGDLQRQVNELKAMLLDGMLANRSAAPSGPQATSQGLVGMFEKYNLDPNYYPNPCERLANEPRLARFAFPLNFELEWNVGVSQYKTIDGINTKEPKFEIQLNRIMLDEETGEPTLGRIVICKGIFHEDPDAAVIVAREQGFDVNSFGEKEFLDEMRYLRIRDWLFEAFFTPLPATHKTNKREMVINGKLVQYFEINDENGASIPFDKLGNKL